MDSDFRAELRRIRITLIVIAIIMVMMPFGNKVTVDHNLNDMSNQAEFHKNLVPLGNGYFGLLTGDMELMDDNQMKIFFYDEKQNKMVLKREVDLDTVELAEE
ncbi:hypothetical protein [Fictibacillus phosphorivorans]|uniref:hypothetical protein n=1 Tax=Fictibacillus phosphorivorans TaxID=1221500 RepID=UPI002042105D|nr:hypothetical protein [Fictibacillus phosphorivorans]MCM3719047.1 hypothetical protein [Fictibacillus phosphorivorans]MCM3776669.1 hypothetical protein [Fictibacillus phosphorivorans]